MLLVESQVPEGSLASRESINILFLLHKWDLRRNETRMKAALALSQSKMFSYTRLIINRHCIKQPKHCCENLLYEDEFAHCSSGFSLSHRLLSSGLQSLMIDATQCLSGEHQLICLLGAQQLNKLCLPGDQQLNKLCLPGAPCSLWFTCVCLPGAQQKLILKTHSDGLHKQSLGKTIQTLGIVVQATNLSTDGSA